MEKETLSDKIIAPNILFVHEVQKFIKAVQTIVLSQKSSITMIEEIEALVGDKLLTQNRHIVPEENLK